MEKYNYLEAVTADAKEAIMYKKYVWYKVIYKVRSPYTGKEYVAFEYAMNTDKAQKQIEKTISKYGNNFIKVKEWVI